MHTHLSCWYLLNHLPSSSLDNPCESSSTPVRKLGHHSLSPKVYIILAWNFPRDRMPDNKHRSRVDQEGWGELPGTGVNVICVGLHRRETTGKGCACHDSRWKGCLRGRNHDRNGLLLSLWPLIVLARAALQWQSCELPTEVNFRPCKDQGRCLSRGRQAKR